MEKYYFAILFGVIASYSSLGQVLIEKSTTINTSVSVETSAILQINSPDKGLLVTRAEKEAIDVTTSNATPSGMLTYDPSENKFYFKTDTGWRKLN